MEFERLHQRNRRSFMVAETVPDMASTGLVRVSVDVTRKASAPRAELGFFIMRPLHLDRRAER